MKVSVFDESILIGKRDLASITKSGQDKRFQIG